MAEAVELLPRRAHAGAGACHLHPSLFAFAFRRRKALQDRSGARRRSRCAIRSHVSGVADVGRHSRPRTARSDHAEGGYRDSGRHRSRAESRAAPLEDPLCVICIRSASIPPPRSSMSSRNFRASRAPWSTTINLTLHEEMRAQSQDRRVRRGHRRLQPRGKSDRSKRARAASSKPRRDCRS